MTPVRPVAGYYELLAERWAKATRLVTHGGSLVFCDWPIPSLKGERHVVVRPILRGWLPVYHWAMFAPGVPGVLASGLVFRYGAALLTGERFAILDMAARP